MDAGTLVSFLPLLLLLLVGAFILARASRAASKAHVAIQATSEASVTDYQGPLAFFRRHYNGDYSLARSYWINTFLVSLFAPVLGMMLLPLLGDRLPARYGSTGFLSITVLGILAWLWAVAGTWASANKHAGRGGKAGWATAAKCMIVLGALRIAIDIASMMPTLKEHLDVAAGAQLGPGTQLEIRADGRSILLSGGINDGSAEQLDRALEAAPDITTVVLSSGGGWVREGKLLAEVIRRHRLNTYVEGYCASACTIAFLAGKERAADPGARIGFHASRSIGSGEQPTASVEFDELRRIYRDAGLPASFVREAIDTPNKTMWHPSHEVLLSAGVLTRKSMGGETAKLSTAVRSRAMLVAEFTKIPLFALLEARAPKDFDGIMDAAWGKMQQGATDAEVITAGRAQLAAALPRFLPLARDETLVAYQTLMQEQLEALRERDVSACVEMAFPSGRAMNVIGNLPAELTQREMALLATVLREADARRGMQADPRAVERVAQRAAEGMTQEQRLVFSDATVRASHPPAVACDAAIKFFAGLNAFPEAERGHALRVLYSAN